MKKIISCLLMVALAVSCPVISAFASTESFSFVSPIAVNNSGEWVDGKSTYYRTATSGTYNVGTPGGEAGQVFDGTAVVAGDYIARQTGGKFGNNVGANNMFYWREPGDNAGSMSFVKQYGGYDGYYGYVANGNMCVNYSNATHRFIRPKNDVDPETVPNNNSKRGVLELSAKDGHAVTFGKYDLNLNGVHVFKARIQGYNQLPTSVLQLVQGKAEDSDECEKVMNIFEWNALGEVRTPASSAPVAVGYGCCANGQNSFVQNKYFDITYVIDTTREKPCSSLEIRFVGNNENRLVSYIPMHRISPDAQSMGSFDFSKDMGIRFKVQKSGGGGAESTLQIKSMSLEKTSTPVVENGIYKSQVRVDNNSGSVFTNGLVIAALYDSRDERIMINGVVNSLENISNNGKKTVDIEIPVADKTISDLKVRYFIWTDLNTLTPVNNVSYDMGTTVLSLIE